MENYQKIEKIGEGSLAQERPKSFLLVYYLPANPRLRFRYIRSCLQSQGPDTPDSNRRSEEDPTRG